MAARTTNGGSNGGLMTEINVTPLVDVMLVLLVLMMVTATTLAMKTIGLELPKAKSGASVDGNEKPLVVGVDQNGALFLDRDPADEATIRARARASVAKNQAAAAIVAADGRARHESVVHALEILRGEHVSKIRDRRAGAGPAMMFPLLAVHSDKKQKDYDLLRWILPGSVALHLVAAVAVPAVKKSAVIPRPISVVVLDAPPDTPPPPPPPKTEERRPEKQIAPTPTTALAPPPIAATNPLPVTEAPLDLTGTTLSNDGPGLAVVAITQQPPVAAPIASTKAPPVKNTQAPAAPLVPSSALARPPRAPGGLDVELERNYPADARASGISGRAVLRVELTPDGRVGKVERVEESYPGFGAACERTVRTGRWEAPLDKEGHAVRTEIKYVCRFEVRS